MRGLLGLLTTATLIGGCALSHSGGHGQPPGPEGEIGAVCHSPTLRSSFVGGSDPAEAECTYLSRIVHPTLSTLSLVYLPHPGFFETHDVFAVVGDTVVWLNRWDPDSGALIDTAAWNTFARERLRTRIRNQDDARVLGCVISRIARRDVFSLDCRSPDSPDVRRSGSRWTIRFPLAGLVNGYGFRFAADATLLAPPYAPRHES
jgi:hypothetical protein